MDGAPQNGSNPKLGSAANLFFEMMLCILRRERGQQSFEMGDDFLMAGPHFSVGIDERSFFSKEIMEVVPVAFAQGSNKLPVSLYLPIGGSGGWFLGDILVKRREWSGFLPKPNRID